MELRCPSCGVTHKSEDYAGAFEIQCSCGYAILLPDEKEVARDEFNFNDMPAAMEVEDDELKISLEKGLSENSSNDLVSDDFNLTPSENLPTGMVYDPFEVDKLSSFDKEEVSLENELSDDLDFSENNNDSEELEDFNSEASFAEDDFLESSYHDTPSEQESSQIIEASQLEEEEEATEEGQKIVHRTQLASIGQIVGASYDLTWSELNRIQLVEVKERLLEELKNWPWLNEELNKRKINLSKLEELKEIKNLPELIAVQLYILCFELGGHCEFKKSKLLSH